MRKRKVFFHFDYLKYGRNRSNMKQWVINTVKNPPYRVCACLSVSLFLSPGPQRSASWMPSVNWRPCWGSASSSHLWASPRPYPSYLRPAPSPPAVSLPQSCPKREAKCCSKDNDQQRAAESSWRVLQLTTSLRASALLSHTNKNRLPSPL